MTGILLSAWRRLRHAWDEIDYAQRRLLEIQSGQLLTAEGRRRAARAEVEQLNALLDLELRADHADRHHRPHRRRPGHRPNEWIEETG